MPNLTALLGTTRYTPASELGVTFDELNLERTGPHSGHLKHGGRWFHVTRRRSLRGDYLKSEATTAPIRSEAQLHRWLDE